ncbi:MAG TPA: TIGR03067 domain-containing protein [Gemmataceae bacterium]|nr:TIGR03067 domain-containing protein [Gemmataceae bacterium]
MMRLIAMVAVSGLLMAAGPVAEMRDDGDDIPKLQGVWRSFELEIQGESLPPDCARSMWLRFHKDSFTIEQGGKITVQGRYTINPASKPKTIDLTITDTVKVVNKGALVLGVYELKNNQLRLCTTKANGQDRPKALVSKRGTAHFLFTFLKEKP